VATSNASEINPESINELSLLRLAIADGRA
jgi:hypothetical protein